VPQTKTGARHPMAVPPDGGAPSSGSSSPSARVKSASPLKDRAPPLKLRKSPRSPTGSPSGGSPSLKARAPPVPQKKPAAAAAEEAAEASRRDLSPRRRSPRPGSPAAGPLRSPRPAALHSQQRSVGPAHKDIAAFATQAFSPQTTQRSQILALDAGHARVHLSPQGRAEDRSARADRDLRKLLGTSGLHRTDSSPGRSASPGSASIRDTLARQQLLRRSEAASKLHAHQRSLQQERAESPRPPASPPRSTRPQDEFTSALAAARARTSMAVTGTPATPRSGGEPEPEPEPEPPEQEWRRREDQMSALFPDTMVSQWGAYTRQLQLQQQPTALQVAEGRSGPPRVEEAAKAEVLRAQKARLNGRVRSRAKTPEPEPELPPPAPEPRTPRSKPVLCVQGGVHTHGPDGCALCNSVREAALAGTLVIPQGSGGQSSPGSMLSNGAPTPAQLGYRTQPQMVDPQVPQLVDPSVALGYQSPLRRGDALLKGHSIPSLLSPVAAVNSSLAGRYSRSNLDGGGGPGYVSPLRASTLHRATSRMAFETSGLR
jgi:hypothetical protein